MKLKFGNTLIQTINLEKLRKKGNKTKVENTKKRIKEGINIIKKSRYKYSNYRLQKITGLSINTIKKYSDYINELLNEN